VETEESNNAVYPYSTEVLVYELTAGYLFAEFTFTSSRIGGWWFPKIIQTVE